MAIAFNCPKCGKSLRVSEEQVGKSGKCPQCQATVEIVFSTLAAHPAAGGPARSLSRADLQLREKIELPRVGVLRKLGTLAVLAVLLLLPVVYAAVLVALAGSMVWLGTSAVGRSLPSVAFWLLEIAAGLLLICLVKRLVEPQRRGLVSYPLELQKEPLLSELLTLVAGQIGSELPKRVLVNFDTRLVYRRRGGGELTVGLPLVRCLNVQELAGAMTSQMALARRGSLPGAVGLIRSINSWLWHSVYGESRLDQWLAVVRQRQHFHAAKLLLPLSAMNWAPRAVLFVPMFIANTVAAGVIRLAERDADVIAARLIGTKALAGLWEREELVDFVWEGVLAELEFLHREQQLPAKLPDHQAVRMLEMTPELRGILGTTLNQPVERAFDSRASRPERVAALAAEPASGLLQCEQPAQAVLSSYEELAKRMSRDFYATRFGGQLLRTAIQAT